MTDIFKRLVFAPRGSTAEIEGGTCLTPKFDDGGVLAAVATDAETGEVLMLAWMDAEALALTIATGEAHFYSRSRKRIWKKGEESGNVLDVVEMRTDCDQDAIWMRVRMRGQKAACHTGRRTCFYRRIPLGQGTGGHGVTASLQPPDVPRLFDPADVYKPS
ncbi:MAG: phosphoribosyl-AMP cyclohydrolase [Hyphomicrobiaceae bacterium]